MKYLLSKSDDVHIVIAQVPQTFKKRSPHEFFVSKSFLNVNVQNNNFTDISDSSTWSVNDEADYFFYCANETVHGLEIHEPIESESPLICDMSSTIASRPIDIKKYDLCFLKLLFATTFVKFFFIKKSSVVSSGMDG